MATRNMKSRPAANAYGFTQLTYWRRILLMLCFFVLMMVLAGFASQLAAQFTAHGSREFYLLTSVFQNLIGFAGTAFVTALFMSTRPLSMLGLNVVCHWRSVLGIILVFAVGLPFLNQTVWWNQQMHFPAALTGLESTIRSWEESALSATGTMLTGTSVSTLLVNIAVIGIFTGFCEELLFRGTFQRVIGSGGLGPHAAIWITAVLFSTLHFQFFGFLPRLLLGAFFGYLLYWTGSVWVSAIAHALNNSITVFASWLIANGMAGQDLDTVGVTKAGFPAVACISLALVLCVLIGMRGYLFSTKRL
ncbi:MAG: CPBP family intramembrane metalloprotease [Muribaculaceae bacterium]|nr:CPBP family intramembrane metalloprotease [Muribaculaceae bacterium]